MKLSKKMAFVLAAATLAATAGVASAHELILKPLKDMAAAGEEVRVDLISTHKFIVADEVEDADKMTLKVVASDAQVGNVLADEAGKTLYTTLKVKSDAPVVLGLEKAGSLYAVTNKGGKGGKTRKQLEDEGLKVKSINKYSKYAKLLYNMKPGDESWKVEAGHDLEIVPLSNPADLKVGDFFDVKVLHHGSSESVSVMATYDGFAPYDNTYAYYTEGDPEGVAHIKITSPGLWFVRVTSTEKGVEGEYDSRVIRSSLSFEVK